ncbi:hypothetical protein D3C73_1037020 [compost metagenome]
MGCCSVGTSRQRAPAGSGSGQGVGTRDDALGDSVSSGSPLGVSAVAASGNKLVGVTGCGLSAWGEGAGRAAGGFGVAISGDAPWSAISGDAPWVASWSCTSNRSSS